MSFLNDFTSNQKFALVMVGLLIVAGVVLPFDVFQELLGFSKDLVTRDEVWATIEDYIDQGLGGSPYQTEKPTLYGLGVVTIAGTDYYYMIDGESGKMLDYHTTESVVLGWIRNNMTLGGNFYIVNMTDSYGLGFEIDSIPNNHTYGTYVFGQAGEALLFGDLLFLQTDGDYMKSDSNATVTMYVVGMAAQDISNTAWGLILIDGYARCDSWVGLGVGSANPIYAGWNGGDLSQSAPNTSGDQVQRIGYPTATKIMRFDLDSTVVEIA